MQRASHRCMRQITAIKLKCAIRRMLFVLLVICGLAINKVHAQYHFEQFTTSKGLPQNTVAAITQTSDGYMWFATYDGLVRYDGVRFTVFDKSNTTGIGSNSFTALCGDGQGFLWIGTTDRGVLRYREGAFTSLTMDHGLSGNNIRRIQRTEDGLPMIFAGNSELRWAEDQSLYARNIFLWNTDDSLASAGQSQLNEFVDRSGTRWKLEPGRLLCVKGDRQISFPVKLTPEDFLTLRYEDQAGNLWFGTRENIVYLIEGGHLQRFTGLDEMPSKGVKIAGEDKEGGIWLFSEKKLLRYIAGRFTNYTAKDGLGSQHLRDVFCDREGTVWVGTNESGVYRLSRKYLQAYTKKQGLLENITYPIYEDRNRNIWVGSNSGISRITNGKVTAYPLILTKKGERSQVSIGSVTDKRSKLTVRCFYEDRDGYLWIGTTFGVMTLKDGKFAWRSTVAEQTYSSTIIQDHTGALWFGTGRGLIKYQAGISTEYTTKNGLPDNRVDIVYEDSGGRLWIGTRSGLACFINGEITSFVKTRSVATQIRAIYEDHEGIIWIGTLDSGLSRFKDGDFINYNATNGLSNNGAFQILEDERGNFWMSSNRGIYRVSRRQLNDFADKKISMINCVAYGSQDGMPSAECNGGRQPAGVKAQNGNLWFATQGGVVSIDPKAVPYTELPPLPTIESVVIGQDSVDFKNGVKIEPFQSDLEINYTAPGFIKAEHIHFKYKLVGLNDDWIDAGTRRTIHYSHLPPGQYTFQLIAANSDGIWTETATTLDVHMEPYFYQTKLFVALWGMILLASGVTINTLRVRRLKTSQRRLTAVVAERTAELMERTQQLEVVNKKLEQQVILDGLTNIANHRHFKEFLAQEWHRSQRDQQQLSVLLIDLDYFKLYNDTYGHQGGDDCLKQVAGVLSETVQRTADLAARYGGEEFVVVLTKTDPEGAAIVAERIRASVEALQIPHIASTVMPYVTLSIGIATVIPNQNLQADDLIAAADRALYRAKENGRNGCWTEAKALAIDVKELYC